METACGPGSLRRPRRRALRSVWGQRAARVSPVGCGRWVAVAAGSDATGGRGRRGVDAHGELDRVALFDVAGDGGDLQGAGVVAEDVVAGEAGLGQVLDGLFVPALGIHGLAAVLGQRDLGGGDGLCGVGDAVGVGVDLEVDVGPAAGVAGREDAGEPDDAALVGDLDPAEVILVFDAVGVHRV